MSGQSVPGGGVHKLPADLRKALIAHATALDTVFTGDPADLAPEERAWLGGAAALGATEGAYAAPGGLG